MLDTTPMGDPHPTAYMPSVVVDDLRVQYQGSLEPQELTLAFEGRIESRLPFWLQRTGALIAAGGAGGAEFPPESGAFEWLEGPQDESGPVARWVLRVAGVSALSLRPLFQALPIYWAPPGFRIHPKQLTLVGSRPIDDPTRAVDAARLREWVAAPSPFAGAWPDMPFAVEHVRSKKGLQVHVELAATPSKEAADRFHELHKLLTFVGSVFPTPAGTPSKLPFLSGDDGAWNGATFVSSFPKADLAGAAPLALVANMLRRFHLETAPVARLRFASPDGPGEPVAPRASARPAKKASPKKATPLSIPKAVGWGRGEALVREVIAALRPKDVPTPRPLSPRQLATLTLPGGRPLPPSLRAWLAFDTEWFFTSPEAPMWREEKVSAILRRMWDLPDDALEDELAEVDERFPAGGLLLPQSAKQQHILYLGQVDEDGEHPIVAFEDTPEGAWVKFAGFDAFVATELGHGKWKLPKEHKRLCRDHARALGIA
jgi:hypothetical protein